MHTDAGREWLRQGSALFKLVTQKRVIISTQERERGGEGREEEKGVIESFLPFSCCLFLPLYLQVWRSDTRRDWAHRARETEEREREREKERHGGTTKQLSPPLADIYTALLSFFLPLPCHVFCSFTLSSIFLVLICWTVYCLVSCLPQFSLISLSLSLSLCFPWSVSLSISFFFTPPLWILFHPSFCLFTFLNLSFSLALPHLAWFLSPPRTLPHSLVFSLSLSHRRSFFFNDLLLLPNPPSICLSQWFLPRSSSFISGTLWREVWISVCDPVLSALHLHKLTEV